MKKNNLNRFINEANDFFACLKNRDSKFVDGNEFSRKFLGYKNRERMVGSDDYHVPSKLAELADTFVHQDKEILSGSMCCMDFITHGPSSNGDMVTLLGKKRAVSCPITEEVGVFIYASDISNNIKLRNMILLSNKKFFPKQKDEDIQFSVVIQNSYPKINTTIRETEALFYTLRGCSTKEIAIKMNISHKTVERHIDNIRERSGNLSKSELIEQCISEGMVDIFPSFLI